jgi:hypothetical protein
MPARADMLHHLQLLFITDAHTLLCKICILGRSRHRAMPDISPADYDLIVIGTGLQESLLAA